MPPKQQLPASRGHAHGHTLAQPSVQSTLKSYIDAAVAPENRGLLTAVGMFAAGIAFLQSGYGEILLPPTF